jgi:hypothetical protein
MKVLFEQKKTELGNKCCVVENKTDYAACIKNAINFLVSKIYILYNIHFLGCFQHALAYVNILHMKVKNMCSFFLDAYI